MAPLVTFTWTVYWIFLPIALLSSVIFRYNLLSCIYFILLLVLPYSPRLQRHKIASWSAYSLTVVIMSALFLLAHVTFQIVLVAYPPYGSILNGSCSIRGNITRCVGFQRLDHENVGMVLRQLLPDVGVFLVSFGTYILVKKTAGVMRDSEQSQLSTQENPKASHAKLKNASVFCLSMIFMALSGIAYPSVVSCIYLVIFMIVAVVWACHQPLLTSAMAVVRALVSILTFLQLLMLYVYQMGFAQDFVPEDALYSRLIGLTAIIKTDCTNVYELLLYPNIAWTKFVSPICIFFLHWTLAVGVRMFYQDAEVLQQQVPDSPLLQPSGKVFRQVKDGEKKDSRSDYQETVATLQPLVEGEELPQSYNAIETASHPPELGSSKEPQELADTHETQTHAQAETNKGILVKVSAWLSDVKKFSFYVVALIIMMLWSVTYHSWLTFVLLLWSCFLWMTTERARYTLYCSPVFVFYGICLVLLQFIYSLNLYESELPTTINQTDGSVLSLSDFGLRRFEYPCLHLGAQILYLCGFWLVLHQFYYLRKHTGAVQEGQTASTVPSWTDRTVNYFIELLCHYWIFVVVGFHLAVSTEGYPTGIKLVYMLFLLLNIVTYVVSWTAWRRTLTLYWTVLVIYTMIVLVLIYTYQFQSFPTYWKSFTNFTDTQLNDLGLVQVQPSGELLLMILLPTLFLLAVILQLQYFNRRFLELTGTPTVLTHTASNVSEQGVERRNTMDYEMNELSGGKAVVKEGNKSWFAVKCNRLLLILTKWWINLASFIMRALEYHVWWLVFVTVYAAAAYQVSGLYAVFVLFWVLLLPSKRLRVPLYVTTLLTVSLIILGVMFYQLQFITEDNGLNYNCTFDFYGVNFTKQYHLTEWIGFGKMSRTQNAVFFYFVEGYIAIVLMIALERTVFRRQQWKRTWFHEPVPAVTAFYPSITWKQLDDGFLKCMKYFVNYFFYKFGVEACFVMTVITVWVRMDIFATIYCVLLIIPLYLHTRAAVFRYWRFYVGILTVLLLWIFFASLGMPPVWCQYNEYPWTILGTNKTVRNRLIRWLYLPDYIVNTDSTSSIADFFQLLFVVAQLHVFERETKIGLKFGGDNRYLTGKELDETTAASNPKKNFMLKGSRTLLDQLKGLVFNYTLWITMAIIFLAGTSRISIFTLGYLIFFFYMLAKQHSLLMGKPSRLLRLINILLGYTVAVITLKASLQIASCVYIDILAEKACVFVQLMSLVCSKTDTYFIGDNNAVCELSYENAGLAWDFVCFLFLLIQRRIFTSYYFLHVADDLRISMQLAARGAELFEEKLIEEVNERKRLEEETITAIRISMRDIKDRYSSLRRGTAYIKHHTDAIRAGDYYMFDETSRKSDLRKGDELEIMDPIKMFHKAGTVGIDDTLKNREEDKKKLEGFSTDDELEDVANTKREPQSSRSEVDGDQDEETTMKPDEVVGEKTPRSSDDHHEAGGDGEVGSSCHDDGDYDADEEEESEAEEEKEKTLFEKLKSALNFLWEVLLSSLDSITLLLNTRNKHYRNVILRLAAEKDQLCKEQLRQEVSPHISASDVMIDIDKDEVDATPETSRRASVSLDVVDLEPIEFDKDQNRLLRLFYAIWYMMVSHTDLVCYFLIILNLMLKASMLALVLPLCVFFWATVSIPRPSKLFWNFCIIYLEIVIVIKFIFQFEFFPWNSLATTNLQINNPFWWPRFIGIEQSATWSVMELLQLLAILFHTSILKVFGLWDAADIEADQGEDCECPHGNTSQEALPSTSTAAIEGVEETEKENGKKNSKTSIAQKLIPLVQKLYVEMGSNRFVHSPVAIKLMKSVKRCVHYAKQPYVLYHKVLNQEFSSVTDVYVYMFLCDVINFIIIIFGYSAFGQYATNTSNVVSNLQKNNVPTGFLVMLIIQFIMMVIDRGLYLRKNLFGKLIFQVFLLVGIHVWMFFILPWINKIPFYQNHVAQTWYFFKVLYFLLSAYQIRAGYPKRVSGNFLTKSFGTANLFLFKGYRAIPFLAEITAIMDWMFTETSMGIGEWMKMWSIHAEVFELKCWRVFENEYPSPRGQAKTKLIKYLVGGFLVFLLFAIIWFPLLLMNVALTIGGVPNNPTQVEVKLSLGPYEPLFQVIADSYSMVPWTSQRYSAFAKANAKDANAAMFLQGFTNNQVVDVNIDGQSKTVWIISPPQLTSLIGRLDPSKPLPVRLLFEWTITKDPALASVVNSYGSREIMLTQNSVERQILYEVLKGTANVKQVPIQNLFPQYIHSLGASSSATAAAQLYSTANNQMISDSFVNVNLTLNTDGNGSWWRIEENPNPYPNPVISMTIFSDKVSPSSLSFLVSYGIIGLYVSVVLLVGRVVRSVFIGTTASLMFTELPYVDRILQLCHDIFLVREEDEFELEEDLFAKLIFLYRSPRTLISWTKPKQE